MTSLSRRKRPTILPNILRWNQPSRLAAGLLFGFFEALQFRLQLQKTDLPNEFLQMMPYLMVVIALVVIATTLFWSLIASLKRTLVSSGSPENLVVMRKGATNDGSSQLTLESLQAIRFFEGIARDADGNPLISPELVVQPFFATTDGGRENVLVRGVEPMALRVHDEVVIAEGRMFNP